MSDVMIERLLDEDRRRLHLPDTASAEDATQAFADLEICLTDLPFNVGYEEHGMPRAVLYQPGVGLLIAERGGGPGVHWTMVPSGILHALKPYLRHLYEQAGAVEANAVEAEIVMGSNRPVQPDGFIETRYEEPDDAPPTEKTPAPRKKKTNRVPPAEPSIDLGLTTGPIPLKVRGAAS